MKKVFIWLLIISMVAAFSLYGCKAEEAAEEEVAEEEVAEEEVAEEETVAEVLPQPPIAILINDSPWYPGFEVLVNQYMDETDNAVIINLTPFSGMLEKSRNAVQADESEFDIINMNEQWYMQFYAGDLVTPILEIDQDFELDPNIIEYAYATRWDPEIGYSGPNGELYGLPINGNIQLYLYRKDLFEEQGVDVPQTWEEVEEVAKLFYNPPDMYGFSIRSIGGNWEYQAYLESYGTNIVSVNEDGQWEVGLASDAAIQATETWYRLGITYGPESFADMGQAENVALMASGQLAQVHIVGAAAPGFQNPETSAVVDKIGAAVVPGGATMSGIWVMGIPHNLPDEQKVAALTFLKWALTKEAQLAYALAGAIPVRQDVYEELSDDPDLGWWMSAMAESTPFIRPQPRLAETAQIMEVVDRTNGKILINELSIEEALSGAALEIYNIMVDAGYDVKPLD